MGFQAARSVATARERCEHGTHPDVVCAPCVMELWETTPRAPEPRRLRDEALRIAAVDATYDPSEPVECRRAPDFEDGSDYHYPRGSAS